MRKRMMWIALGVAGFLCSGYAMTQERMATDTVVEVNGKMMRVPMRSCNEKHEGGCHAGGVNATACSIDNGFFPCLGTIGGGCSISCKEGYYACCGKTCKCDPNKKEK